ncbi:MAG: hypothetical protein ACJAXX_001899 [Roseivirga sp.]|jgi:hypothetical protein
MKRKLFFGCLLGAMFISFNSNAQELGVRFGNVTGGDYAIDAVFGTAKFSRIHANLSFGSEVVGIEALWDFIYRPIGVEAINWYVGVGPFLGLGNDFSLGAVGEIGLEYRFVEIPLAIGLDWRPAFEIIDETNFVPDGFGFNIRYVFSQGKRD